jgi:hypothetical protein
LNHLRVRYGHRPKGEREETEDERKEQENLCATEGERMEGELERQSECEGGE